MLDLKRIIAGPVAGRTPAAHGADVMLINGPHLPNIEAIADTSRGKRSARLDLRARQGRQALRDLVAQSSGFGALRAVLSRAAPGWQRPSVPPGTDAAAWQPSRQGPARALKWGIWRANC